MKHGELIVRTSGLFQPRYQYPQYPVLTASRPAINKWMGGPELGSYPRTHQCAHKTHCRTYEKPPGNDPGLHVRTLDATSIAREHGHAPITHFTRVSRPIQSTERKKV